MNQSTFPLLQVVPGADNSEFAFLQRLQQDRLGRSAQSRHGAPDVFAYGVLDQVALLAPRLQDGGDDRLDHQCTSA